MNETSTFRGKSGKLINIPLQDELGMSPYVERLERGRFLLREREAEGSPL